MKNLGESTAKSSGQVSDNYSLAKIKHFLGSNYPDIEFPDHKNNPFQAIAVSGYIIFKQFPPGSITNAIKSIQFDIKNAGKKNSLYKSLIYISTDSNFLDPLLKKEFLNKVSTDFSVDVIPYSFFEQSPDLFLDSPGLVEQTLLAKHNFLIDRPQSTIPILLRIFEHVDSIPQYYKPETDEQQFLNLDEKIKANFYATLQKDVHNDILDFWQTKMIIESYIKKSYNHYRRQFDQLKSAVVHAYLSGNKQAADDEVNDILIFESMAKSILPADLKENPDGFGCAKSVVYYFFEYCLFGRKTNNDQETFKFPEP